MLGNRKTAADSNNNNTIANNNNATISNNTETTPNTSQLKEETNNELIVNKPFKEHYFIPRDRSVSHIEEKLESPFLELQYKNNYTELKRHKSISLFKDPYAEMLRYEFEILMGQRYMMENWNFIIAIKNLPLKSANLKKYLNDIAIILNIYIIGGSDSTEINIDDKQRAEIKAAIEYELKNHLTTGKNNLILKAAFLSATNEIAAKLFENVRSYSFGDEALKPDLKTAEISTILAKDMLAKIEEIHSYEAKKDQDFKIDLQTYKIALKSTCDTTVPLINDLKTFLKRKITAVEFNKSLIALMDKHNKTISDLDDKINHFQKFHENIHPDVSFSGTSAVDHSNSNKLKELVRKIKKSISLLQNSQSEIPAVLASFKKLYNTTQSDALEIRARALTVPAKEISDESNSTSRSESPISSGAATPIPVDSVTRQSIFKANITPETIDMNKEPDLQIYITNKIEILQLDLAKISNPLEIAKKINIFWENLDYEVKAVGKLNPTLAIELLKAINLAKTGKLTNTSSNLNI